jgi:hypothetical protein
MPAGMRFYSEYDRVVGHVRRYEPRDMEAIARNHGLSLDIWSYWGLPLYPLLMLRTLTVRPGGGERETIEKGFRPPGPLAGRMLGSLLSMERLPNHFLGTSILGLYSKPFAR